MSVFLQSQLPSVLHTWSESRCTLCVCLSPCFRVALALDPLLKETAPLFSLPRVFHFFYLIVVRPTATSDCSHKRHLLFAHCVQLLVFESWSIEEEMNKYQTTLHVVLCLWRGRVGGRGGGGGIKGNLYAILYCHSTYLELMFKGIAVNFTKLFLT